MLLIALCLLFLGWSFREETGAVSDDSFKEQEAISLQVTQKKTGVRKDFYLQRRYVCLRCKEALLSFESSQGRTGKMTEELVQASCLVKELGEQKPSLFWEADNVSMDYQTMTCSASPLLFTTTFQGEGTAPSPLKLRANNGFFQLFPEKTASPSL